MFHLERILVPIDFSEHSAVAVSQAAALAHKFRSQITLLHVNEFSGAYAPAAPLGFGRQTLEAARAEEVAGRRQRLEEFGSEELAGLPVKRILCCGDPAGTIVRCAGHSDLILIATYGHGMFRRFLLGSVTAKVLHDAECPVWTTMHCGQDAEPPVSEIRRILCAVNLGSRSANVARFAGDLAARAGAELTVAHVVLDNPPNLPERYMFQWHDEAHWGADERLHVLLTDLGIRAEPLVLSGGDVSSAISKGATENRADLLVIGRNCEGREARPLGGTAYSVICDARCPVISV